MEQVRMGSRLAISLVCLIAITTGCTGAATGGASPPSTAAPRPDRLASGNVIPALTETFKSSLYGYEIKHPATFQSRAATEALQGAAPPFIDSPVVDQLSATTGAVVVMSSADLASGGALADWTAATALEFCGAPTSSESLKIGSEQATLSTFAFCEGLFHQWVTTVHGGRGYHVVWANQRGTESADRALFLEMLDTFAFGPSPSRSPGPSAAAGLRPLEDGDPIPDALLGTWYHGSGAFLWILRGGDRACMDLPRTMQDCAIWQWPNGRRPEAGILTVVDGRLALQWTQGGCSGMSIYSFGVPVNRLALRLVSGCQSGDFALTRAGTGAAPTAPSPLAP